MSTQKAARMAAAACLGKTRFDTWGEAKRVLKHLLYRDKREVGHDMVLGVYQCRHCHKMHIGNQPKKRGRR